MQTPLDNNHIVPNNDLEEHLISFDCWCDPEIRYDFPPYLIIHNSADKREYNELDNPKCNISKC